MNNTTSQSAITTDAIGKLAAKMKNQPATVQTRLMWILIQMLAAEVEQLKAYRDADSMSLLHHAELLENSTIDNSALESKLVAEIGNLARELG